MLPICEGCDFFDVCHSQAENDNTLSQVAYLGKQTRSTLLSFRYSFAANLSVLPPLPPLPYPTSFSKTGTEIEDLHHLLEGFQVWNIERFNPPNTIMNGPILGSLKLAAPCIEAARYQRIVATGTHSLYSC